ncbi:hypothetical protein [Micromonospora sp. MH33]|uniref:hypothetical protein n=1 Tax=Micromonospora sp. MH33 TaxID=1945509 RepID=UPI0011B1CB09|nr:hypothetical protein [Micromonospora sp. MH33]
MRLPYVWRYPDPEPDDRVTRVFAGPSWWQQWTRVPPPHKDFPDYHWFNGDKYRPWNMLTRNRGPMYNTERFTHMRRLQRHRRGRYWSRLRPREWCTICP